jgi:hypothetical protein
MIMVRRAIVVAFEVVMELVLLGVIFTLGIGRKLTEPYAASSGVLVVSVVLSLFGYCITRPILGLFWGLAQPWLYAAFAAALFVSHTTFALAVLYSKITPEAKRLAPILIISGSAIVFACALTGRNVLAKWSLRKKPG